MGYPATNELPRRKRLGIKPVLRNKETDIMRSENRTPDIARDLKITTGFTMHAEGSVLVEYYPPYIPNRQSI